MKLKEKIIAITACIIILVFLLAFGGLYKSKDPKNVYQVYLNGQKMGLIADDQELYNLIDKGQQHIKDKYDVDNVYPPIGFEIVKYTTYEDNITKASNIYDKIKDQEDFTIQGYQITIDSPDENKKDIVVNVLDENVFKEAVKNVVTAFISEEDFNNYINNSQKEIVDTGKIIEHMYFDETINIKKTLISANDKIYTDVTELTQFLLFGNDTEQKNYKVKQGDTIASISEENKLNPKEFLVANPKFRNENSLLAIGETVNISLINPQLTLVEELHVVEDVESVMERETVYDDNKSGDYSEVTQPGVTGITRFTQKVRVVNGEQNQGVEVVSKETIREPVTEITTKGRYSSLGYSGYTTGTFIDTGGDWAWPTNSPYIITSEYEYRWGSFHTAIDISGTGHGSPIYAAKDGVVVTATYHYSLGNYVVIQHENNYYTLYAHLAGFNCGVGQTVSRGQVIGYMGTTGFSTGTHLHYSASIGMPYEGGEFFNPWLLYR